MKFLFSLLIIIMLVFFSTVSAENTGIAFSDRQYTPFIDTVSDSEYISVDESATEKSPLWCEVYSEGGIEPQDEHNIASLSNVLLGKRFNAFVPLDIYAKLRILKDTKGYFYNNHANIGIGFRADILNNGSLQFFAEGSSGNYLTTHSHKHAIESIQQQVDILKSLDQNLEMTNAMIRSLKQTMSGGNQDKFIDEIASTYLPNDITALKRYIDSLKVKGILYADSVQLALATIDDHLRTLQNYTGKSGEKPSSVIDSLQNTISENQSEIATISDMYLNEVAKELAQYPEGIRMEFRVGLVYWKGWGETYSPNPSNIGFPFRFWGDIYGDIVYNIVNHTVFSWNDQKEGFESKNVILQNAVLYVNPKIGCKLLETPAGSLALYGGGAAWVDTHGDWWNNKAYLSPGIHYKPIGTIDLIFKGEYIFGAYYGRHAEGDENPNSSTFSDWKVSVSFWYGLGL